MRKIASRYVTDLQKRISSEKDGTLKLRGLADVTLLARHHLSGKTPNHVGFVLKSYRKVENCYTHIDFDKFLLLFRCEGSYKDPEFLARLLGKRAWPGGCPSKEGNQSKKSWGTHSSSESRTWKVRWQCICKMVFMIKKIKVNKRTKIIFGNRPALLLVLRLSLWWNF